MQQMEQAAGLGGAERKRVEAVVETLATLRNQGETLSEVAHDARNMVTASVPLCTAVSGNRRWLAGRRRRPSRASSRPPWRACC